MAAHRAVLVVFALAGVCFASWAARIADAKHALALTPGELGSTLLFTSVGSLIALPLSGRLATRVGVVGAIRIGLATALASNVGIGLGITTLDNRWVLAASLALLGIGVAVWDVAMNLEGATVERDLGRTVMPSYHAGFSAGTVVAALVGAAMSYAGVSILGHLAVVGVVIVGLGWWVTARFLPEDEVAPAPVEVPAGTGPSWTVEGVLGWADSGEMGDVGQASEMGDVGQASVPGGERAGKSRRREHIEAGSAWLERRTLVIGMVVFAAAFTEGTANDWLAVGFVDGYGVPRWAGTLAFAVFLLFMTLARMLGGSLIDRYGRVTVVRTTFLIAIVGAVLVIVGPVWAAYLGAGIWGVGAALGFPVGMSASADDPRRAAARMSVVATIGYGAFIAGPPLLGHLGDRVGILPAFSVVVVLLLIAVFAVPAVSTARSTD
ncbi:MAG: MFS transporter [Nostocoides sp.]